MSENTSATGGFLTPEGDAAPQPLADEALVDFLQETVAGVLGIDSSLVRPRWQPEPPNLPQSNTSWVAMGITLILSDWDAAVAHEGDENAGNGETTLLRQQTINVLCSCFGPKAQSYADTLRDGLQISQNREALIRNGFDFIGTEDAVSVPSLVKEKWLLRLDVLVVFTRQIQRVYRVLNIESAAGTIDAGQVQTDINVNR